MRMIWRYLFEKVFQAPDGNWTRNFLIRIFLQDIAWKREHEYVWKRYKHIY